MCPIFLHVLPEKIALNSHGNLKSEVRFVKASFDVPNSQLLKA